jgi:hypothetical protein
MCVIAGALQVPLIAETIVIMADHQAIGSAILSIGGTDEADHVIGVAEMLSSPVLPPTYPPDTEMVILASVRPDDHLRHDDYFRWIAASELFADAGLRLVDWFIITSLDLPPLCPRLDGNDPGGWP